MINFRSQSGFTLIELLIYLAIASTALIYLQDAARRESENRAYKALGNEIAQYNNAIRSRISMEPGIAAGTYTGTAWLKDNTCSGTAPQPYLPCSHPDITRVGGYTYSTVLTNTGAITATTSIGPIQRGGVNRADLSGLAAITANGFQSTYFSPAASSTFFGFTSSPATATITAVASTTPNLDAWLRVDGSNQMQADINFDATAANRNINNADVVNANRGVFATDVTAPIFRDSDNPANRFIDPSVNSLLEDLTVAGGDINLSNGAGNRITSVTGLDIQAAGTLNLNTVAGAGDVVIGGAGGTGNLLADDVFIRSRNNWLSRLSPNIVHKNSYRVVHNSIIPKPSCPGGGLARVYMSDNVQIVRKEPSTNLVAEATARNISATAWRARIGSYGSSGFTSNSSAWAIAKTACFYL